MLRECETFLDAYQKIKDSVQKSVACMEARGIALSEEPHHRLRHHPTFGEFIVHYIARPALSNSLLLGLFSHAPELITR
jgi:hypothetical protein